MKLTKKVEREIRRAIGQMQEGIDFIMEDSIRIVRITSCATLPESAWKSGSGETGIAIQKEIGSKLCQLYNAKKNLENILLQP